MGGELSALPGRHGAEAPERGRGPGPSRLAARGPPVPGGRIAPTPSAVCGPAPGPLVPRCRFAAPSAFCALRVPPCAASLRGSAPARPARPPLRGPGPAHSARPRFARLPGPGPAPRPPGSPARPLCAAARLRGRSLAPLRLGSASAALRAPCSVALAALWPPRCASRGLAGASPARPLRGFGPGGLRPGGLRGPSGRLFWPPAPGAFVLARPAALRYHLRRGLSRSSERPLRGRS